MRTTTTTNTQEDDPTTYRMIMADQLKRDYAELRQQVRQQLSALERLLQALPKEETGMDRDADAFFARYRARMTQILAALEHGF